MKKTCFAPIFLIAISILFPTLLNAAPPYRCSGKIQMWPCGQAFPGNKAAGSNRLGRVSHKQVVGTVAPAADAFAKIVSKKLTNLPKDLGLWSGRVEGNGDIHLTLQIFREGQLADSKYMGAVKLVNKSTSFAFKSQLPTGSQWTWDVVARAM